MRWKTARSGRPHFSSIILHLYLPCCPHFCVFFTQLRTAYCTLQFLTYVFTQLALKIFVLDSYTVTKCNVTGLLYRPEINVITLAVSVVTFFGHLEIEMVQHNEILTLIYFSAAECTVTRQFFPSLIRLSKEWWNQKIAHSFRVSPVSIFLSISSYLLVPQVKWEKNVWASRIRIPKFLPVFPRRK